MNNLGYHILLCMAVFPAFLWFSLYASGMQEKRFSHQSKQDLCSSKNIKLQILGSCILSISWVLPWPYLSISSLFEAPNFTGHLIITFIALIAATTGLGLYAARKILAEQSFKQNLPSRYNLFVYLTTRIIYLTLYEAFFRGILFLGSLQFTNLTVAIFINLMLYFLVHLRDSKAELMGTIPFGLVLCNLTFYTQSVWPAIGLHLLLSLSHEGYLLYHLTLKTIKK